jgi:hypothetical protein
MSTLINLLFFALVATLMIVAILTPSLSYAFTIWNVNLNKTVNLPVKPTYNQTTITDSGSCGYDGIVAIKNVEKEKIQNPTMFKSDAFTSIQLPNDTKYLWCGIAK